MPLASMSLEVHHWNRDPPTPGQQGIRLYSHGGVDDFNTLINLGLHVVYMFYNRSQICLITKVFNQQDVVQNFWRHLHTLIEEFIFPGFETVTLLVGCGVFKVTSTSSL